MLHREELQELYLRLHDLIAYNELNREGFRKALKKHDKVLARVAPKRLEEQRPRWETVLSETSKEKLQARKFPTKKRTFWFFPSLFETPCANACLLVVTACQKCLPSLGPDLTDTFILVHRLIIVFPFHGLGS